LSRLAN